MSENNQVVVAQPQQKATHFTQVREKLGRVSLIAGAAMLPAVSFAAEITSLGESMTAEIDASKAVVITIFGAAVTVIGLFLGFKYLKRGANAA